ncbi:MAG: GDSL-type esterase/lipase family protein [Gracilimonas sp.]|nr:GDSL-type esterase/lipase family protein [Gracilimonas sp.]
MAKGRLKRILFWVITLLIPVVLFLVLELSLRLGGYGEHKQDLFVEVKANPEYVSVNPAFVSRYFPLFSPDIARSPFLKKKDEDTFRIFVLGGSSTQGFPYNFYSSFSSQLEQRLLMETVGLNVEVINLGMTAVNSYVIRDLSKRVIKYKPDAILIYAGHNEYYGSFGVGSTQFGFGDGVGLKRLILKLKDLRLYQLFEELLISDGENNKSNRTLMARVVKDSGIPINSDLYRAGINQFKENLSDVLNLFKSENIPVFIGTVTSNLKDQDPLGDLELALETYERGNTYFASGNMDSARSAYLNSKELDPIRFRAPEGINKVIREAAQQFDAYTVEVNRAAAQASESTIQDHSFFTDHLHPDWEGHQLIADLFFEKMKSNVRKVNEAYLSNPLFKRTTESDFEKIYASVQVKRLLVGYPFQKGLTGEEEYAQFQEVYENHLKQSYIDSIAAHTWRTQRDIALALTDVINHVNQQSDTVSVLKHYQQLVNWQLFNPDLLKKGVNYAIHSRQYDPYSAQILHSILRVKRYDPFFANRLAALYLFQNDLKRSEYWLKKVEELDDRNPLLWYSYARLYLLKGDKLKAQNAYQKYLELQK